MTDANSINNIKSGNVQKKMYVHRLETAKKVDDDIDDVKKKERRLVTMFISVCTDDDDAFWLSFVVSV